MDAAPRDFSVFEIDPTGGYKCPLCGASPGPPELDIGCVYCPMFDNQVICLGCCLDYQSVARSDHFPQHPYYEDFVRFSKMTNKSVTKLRRICLEHQQSVLESNLESGADHDLELPMRELLEVIKRRLKSVD